MPPDTMREFDPLACRAEEWPPLDTSLFDVADHASTPFPLDALPRPVADWVERAARGVVDPAMVALPLLVYAAAAVGNAREIVTPRGQREPFVLWGALTGASGTRKSGALHMLAPAVNAIARAVETRAMGIWPSPEPEIGEGGDPKPVLGAPCWLVGSITGERLAVDAWHNGRGLVVYTDELASIIANLDRYTGSDRGLFLSGYDAARHSYRRRGNDVACTVERNALTVIGSIQPERVSALLMGGLSDGLASRFIYAWPAPVRWTRDGGGGHPPEAAAVEAWLRRLLSLSPGGLSTAPHPAPIVLTDDAWELYAAWREADEHAVFALPETRWREWRAKAAGRVLRVAATLAFLAWVSQYPDAAPPDHIDAESLRGALAVEAWASDHAHAVHGAAALPVVEADARIVAAYLRDNDARHFNHNDHRSGDGLIRPLLRDPKRRNDVLGRLEDGGLIRPAGRRSGAVPGRRSSDYDVRPGIQQRAGLARLAR